MRTNQELLTLVSEHCKDIIDVIPNKGQYLIITIVHDLLFNAWTKFICQELYEYVSKLLKQQDEKEDQERMLNYKPPPERIDII